MRAENADAAGEDRRRRGTTTSSRPSTPPSRSSPKDFGRTSTRTGVAVEARVRPRHDAESDDGASADGVAEVASDGAGDRTPVGAAGATGSGSVRA
jgi:hypothetical protein